MLMKEDIADNDYLFRRVLPRDCAPPKCFEGAFLLNRKKEEKELSVNWDKYSSVESSSICPILGKKFYVAKLCAIEPRKQGLTVDHSPTKKNFSHSIIFGADLFDKKKALKIASYLASKSPILV